MQFIKPDVSTICVGIAMSMGALLLAGGAKGKRMALPNSRILIHQVWRRLPGTGDRHRDPGQGDDRAQAPARGDHGRAHRQDIEKVTQDMDRDYFMSAEEAKEYGIIDRVIAHR